MIVHQQARRGQVIYATAPERPPTSRRSTGRRSANRDDKGREVMPFDVFVNERREGRIDVGGLMIDAFGGRAWRCA